MAVTWLPGRVPAPHIWASANPTAKARPYNLSTSCWVFAPQFNHSQWVLSLCGFLGSWRLHHMVDSASAYSSTKCWLNSKQTVLTVPILWPLLCQSNTTSQSVLRKCFMCWVSIAYVPFQAHLFIPFSLVFSSPIRYQDLLGTRNAKLNMTLSQSLQRRKMKL